MHKLITAIAMPGFSWPICPSAGTGKPGREIYEQCPPGFEVTYGKSGNGERRLQPDRCEKMIDTCRNRTRAVNKNQSIWRNDGGRDMQDKCLRIISQRRKHRTDSYFFDVADQQGNKRRFWFNLDP